jgi:uncharacterized protein (DUF697 family)
MARKKTPDVMGELLGGKAVDPKSAERKAGVGKTPNAKTAATKMAEPAKVTSIVKEKPPEEKRPEAVNVDDDYEVQRIIDRYALWAAGIGLVPMPFVDLVALSGLQVRMLSALARHYDIHFSESAGRALIVSLASSVGAHAVGRGAIGSVLKSVPIFGWVAGLFILPVSAGAFTYAVGRVFALHFSSGGTFLTADTEAFNRSFKDQYNRGLAFFGRCQGDS